MSTITIVERVLKGWAEGLLKEHPNIERLVMQVRYDLLFGPPLVVEDEEGDFHDYPGYPEGVRLLHEWADEHIPSDAWVDTNCEELLWQEPEGYWEGEPHEDGSLWFEPCWEDYFRVLRPALLGAVLTREVVREAFGG